MDAVEQMTRLDSKDEERRTDQNRSIFLISLNIYSIIAKYEDLKEDKLLSKAQVLCLQESWLKPNRPADYDLEGFSAKHFNTVRHGAGLATYFNDPFSFVRDITAVSYQITVVCSSEICVINLYRSKDASHTTLINSLRSAIQEQTHLTTYICGDFNFCHHEERNHPIYRFLSEENFIPCGEPQASHREGRCIDMIWMQSSNVAGFNYSLKPVYYSDHGQQILKLNS